MWISLLFPGLHKSVGAFHCEVLFITMYVLCAYSHWKCYILVFFPCHIFHSITKKSSIAGSIERPTGKNLSNLQGGSSESVLTWDTRWGSSHHCSVIIYGYSCDLRDKRRMYWSYANKQESPRVCKSWMCLSSSLIWKAYTASCSINESGNIPHLSLDIPDLSQCICSIQALVQNGWKSKTKFKWEHFSLKSDSICYQLRGQFLIHKLEIGCLRFPSTSQIYPLQISSSVNLSKGIQICWEPLKSMDML